eukprot:scaffold49393_cov69-Phaeocystis_antarctica.AAC.1
MACAWQSLPPSRLLVDEVVLLAGRQVEAERLAEVIDESRRFLPTEAARRLLCVAPGRPKPRSGVRRCPGSSCSNCNWHCGAVRLSDPSPSLSCRPKILIAYELGSTGLCDIPHTKSEKCNRLLWGCILLLD